MAILSASEARAIALANVLALTPTERQQILRKLKHGPALPKAELAQYANKLRKEALAKRKELR